MKRQKTLRNSGVNRRDFFKSAGAGLIASQLATGATGRPPRKLPCASRPAAR